ncbi:hypothetical protein ACKVMT_15740 [Halobacteriales archaeon Cl-PHB]
MSVTSGNVDGLPGPLLLFTGLLLLASVASLSSSAEQFGLFAALIFLYGVLSVVIGTVALGRS